MSHSRIAGTGSYLPARVMHNKDFEKLVDTSDEWITERTGIKRRHIAADDETTSDMGLAAARAAIEGAAIDISDIDLIIVATTTPDKVFPSTACIVQRRLDLHAIPADRFIRTGGASNVLIIGSETYSRLLDWTDRGTCVLFGDGAGAIVLSATDEPGVISTHIHADGAFEDSLHVPAGISSGYDTVRAESAFIHMKGHEVFKKAVGTLGSMAKETLSKNNVDKHDIDWFIPHQANLRIIAAAAKKLDLPMERVVVTVDEQANTSSASIPLALDTAVRDGRIKRGELLLFEAFGAGFTWGSALVRY
jgi:3-oxoacyl-[acyl-carrier-protein] synthase-3